MPSFNSNIAALIAHHGLFRANADMTLRLERITTSLRINRASDDPAGLVRADRLAMQLRGLAAAIDSAEQGSALIAAADAQLASIADRLETLKGLVAEIGDGSDPSPNERQLAIDAELGAILNLANTATFGSTRLLDGASDYQTSTLDRTRLARLQIHQADLALGTVMFTLDVDTEAERASLLAPLNSGSFVANSLIEDVSLTIRGPRGSQTFDFAAGTGATTMVTAINQARDLTGIEANLGVFSGTSCLQFRTIEYGSSQEVEVTALPGAGAAWTTYAQIGGPVTTIDQGVDVGGLVNGMRWQGDGLSLYHSSPALVFSATLTEAYGTSDTATTETVFVRGGGLAYQTGAGSTSNDRVFFGIPSVVPSQLGYILGIDKSPRVLSMIGTGGPLAIGSGSDPSDAIRVVEQAIEEVSRLRARLGAIDSTRLSGAIESLQSAIEAVSIGEARIRDADVAAETSALVRAQILSEASISMIGAANSSAQSLLRLLGR